MTTDEQIDIIRKCAEKATEGPWRASSSHMFPNDGVREIQNSDGNQIFWSGLSYPNRIADVEFAANAREYIPFLLAELEKAKRAADNWRKVSIQLSVTFHNSVDCCYDCEISDYCQFPVGKYGACSDHILNWAKKKVGIPDD